MVRAPCCEKMGLKKGPWTPEEDHILTSYIHKHGHGNWRALPKQAGLLRCGKSCRLRWTNYLRPDIKRGNFTEEEENTIIHLHEILGNRWSAIAARLAGRTDNEIKNVWHTHLKKRLKNYEPPHNSKRRTKAAPTTSKSTSDDSKFTSDPNSPQQSSSEVSTVTGDSLGVTMTTVDDHHDRVTVKHEEMESYEYIPEIDESFWTDDLSTDNDNTTGVDEEVRVEFPTISSTREQSADMLSAKMEDDMDFWYNVFIKAGDLPELPEF